MSQRIMGQTITSLPERLEALLHHFGLERAHVGACMSGDWGGLVAHCGHRLTSLTLVVPHLNKGIPDRLSAFAAPVLVVTGDQGAPADRARDLARRLPGGELVELSGYFSPAWVDTLRDRTEEAGNAMLDFLARVERRGGMPGKLAAAGEGEIAGLRYRIHGQGPALVLMPLSLAPSQWEPLLPLLSQRYGVAVLGGAHLGIIPLLEERAKSGYGELVAHMLDRSDLGPGRAALEVGCGSGAVTRMLAARMGEGARVTAVDLNPYMLSEARALAHNYGLAGAITFEQGDAQALPYPDADFDVVVCTTVLEEGNADRMVAELTRVTRPGGRLAIVTRAIDVNWWINLAVPAAVKSRIDALARSTGSGVGERGCADASLYRRLIAAGLVPTMLGPQYAIYRDGERLADVLERLLSVLAGDDERLCRDAIAAGKTDGTVFVAEPFHCAVVIKPAAGRER